jgi:hypothetical protein
MCYLTNAMRRVVLLLALASCSTSKKEIHDAQHSVYDVDFATVYSAALEATRELYPNLDDNPGNGMIHTAWHQVQYASNMDDAAQATPVGGTGALNGGGMNGMGSPAGNAAGMPTHLTSKKYFVRFDISVLGGRPWKVKVVGHAKSWDVGAAEPVELHGAARPSWLSPRVDALQVEIYKKVKRYAVPMKDEETKVVVEDDTPKTDPSTFKDIAPEAAKALASLKDALAKREPTGIRPSIADDVVWSLGAEPGADTAMVMWQADSDSLEQMAKLVGEACAADGDKKVRCPGGEATPGHYQLVLEPRGNAWKVTSFVKAE